MQISRPPFTRGGSPNNRWKRDLIRHRPQWFLANFEFFAAFFEVGRGSSLQISRPRFTRWGPPNNRRKIDPINYSPRDICHWAGGGGRFCVFVINKSLRYHMMSNCQSLNINPVSKINILEIIVQKCPVEKVVKSQEQRRKQSGESRY